MNSLIQVGGGVGCGVGVGWGVGSGVGSGGGVGVGDRGGLSAPQADELYLYD